MQIADDDLEAMAIQCAADPCAEEFDNSVVLNLIERLSKTKADLSSELSAIVEGMPPELVVHVGEGTGLWDILATSAASVAKATNAWQKAEADLREAEDRFSAHTKHVGRFLTEMYQTMVDPLEDSGLNVADLCELLLHQARQDREKLNRSPANYPADWNEDSSLETWFPLTAEEMKRNKSDLREAKTALERLRKSVYSEIDMHQDIFSWQQGDSRNALVCAIRDKVDALFAPPHPGGRA